MSRAGRILIVDDDERAAEMFAEILKRGGFEVHCADSGEAGLAALAAQDFDAVVLDWVMPGMDGPEVCRRIRARTDDCAHIGILMFSGRRMEDKDELDILNLADDFIRKGRVNADVFLMRLRAVIQRRAGGAMDAPMPDSTQPELLFCDSLEINLNTRAVRLAGKAVTALTPRQFDLLALLVKNAGQVVPHARLIAAIDDGGADAQPDCCMAPEWKTNRIRAIDEEMRQIREALGDVEKKRIVAVRGIGYFLARSKNE